MTHPPITMIAIAKPAEPDRFEEGFWAGRADQRRALVPLVEAITDALLMFKDIEKARNLHPMANATGQYVAMGKQLEALLELSGLKERA